MAAVVLLQLDHRALGEVALELEHVAGRGAAKGVDGLVVVADCEDGVVRACQQLEPAILQPVGVLEFVHQDVGEALLVVLLQHLVARQQLEAAQQQLGEIDHALAVAQALVLRVQLVEPARILVVYLNLPRAQALFLVAVDEVLEVAGRILLVVHVQGLEQPLDHCELILGVQDLEGLRQARIPEVHAQQPVAQAVEGAHPHPARVDGEHGGDAGEHLARGLVREGDRQHAARAHLPGLDQPGDARGENARLAAAGARQDQRGLLRQSHCCQLLWIQTAEDVAGVHVDAGRRIRSIILPAAPTNSLGPNQFSDTLTSFKPSSAFSFTATTVPSVSLSSPLMRTR